MLIGSNLPLSLPDHNQSLCVAQMGYLGLLRKNWFWKFGIEVWCWKMGLFAQFFSPLSLDGTITSVSLWKSDNSEARSTTRSKFVVQLTLCDFKGEQCPVYVKMIMQTLYCLVGLASAAVWADFGCVKNAVKVRVWRVVIYTWTYFYF